jgi:heme A synthase
MIAAIIFVLHGLAAIYAFWSRNRKEGLMEGVLALAFVVIIFSVGWTIATFTASLLFSPKGIARWLDRNTISLVLVTLGETIFYAMFLRSGRTANPAGTDKGTG